MKKLFLLFVLLWGADRLSAQMQPMSLPAGDTDRFSVASAQLLQAMLAGKTDSTRAIKHHGRWQTFWEDRVAGNALPTESIFGKAVVALDTYLRTPGQCLGNGFAGNWQCLGPFINYFGQTVDHAGRTVSLWVKPTDPNYILTGSSAGGLWKTVDGGHNWVNITDNFQGSPIIPGTMGVTDIAVSPVDENIIYIATGNSQGGLTTSFWDGRYGLGIAYSINGGQTWHMDMGFRSVSGAGTTDGWVSQEDVIKLAYSESTGKLYAMAPHKIFMKANQSTAWQDITPSIVTNMPWPLTLSDFECTHNSTGKIVFSTMGTREDHKLFIYNESTGQWTSRTFQFNPNVVPPALPVAWGIYDMAINGADDIYLLVQINTEHEYRIYKTGLALNSPLILKNNDIWASAPNPGNPNWDNHSTLSMRRIVASQVNPDLIYVVNTAGNTPFLHKSTNGGQTLSYINCTHADGRAVLLYHGGGNNPNGDDDIIYACEDGGISKKAAGAGQRFYSLCGNGLIINQFLSISTNPANDGMAVAGAIDNGNFSYFSGRPNIWEPTVSTIDGMIDVFANNGEPVAFTQYQYFMHSPFTFDQSNHVVTSPFSVPSTPDHVTGQYVKWQRPLHFNSGNTAQYGRHFIWKRQLYDPYTVAWKSEFGTYLIDMKEPKGWIKPIDDSTNKNYMSAYKKPVEFFVSEKNPNIGYIAYYNINWDGNAQTNDTIGNLFRTIDHGVNWTNISPSRVTFGPITDIAVDPVQPNRIWVSYGATNAQEIGTFPQNRTKRVLYSNNYGLNNSWVDVSKGLPPMPIIQLLYVPGSDDILFAATDVGVYRWNKTTGQWECFNEGMPQQIITYLDYIPCSGRLRVATYGRGIWESNVYPDNNYTPGMTDEISTNTTWSSSKTITGSIRVKTGATLTISGASTKIYMPKESRILVEPNAKLIVDGATITNGCDGCRWQGVELTGNKNQPPLPQYQGYIEMKNGAVLEKASMAIRNFTWDNGAQGGGIIKASNSTFHNCWRAVELNDYAGHSYLYNGVSQCNFSQVHFLVDDVSIYGPGGHGEAFVSSFGTLGGIIFSRCDFENSIPLNQLAQNDRERAIYIFSTGINISNCTFEGFKGGIYSAGYTGIPTRSNVIFNNSFNHITDNIDLAASEFGDIRSNDITNMYSFSYPFPGGGTGIRMASGIYLDQAQGTYVGCGNTIDGITDGIRTPRWYGIIVNNSDAYTTTVSDNVVTNMYAAFQTQKRNTRLHIFCNQFEDNAFAMSINPISTSGFLNDQGTGCQVTDIRAGNKFVNNQKDIYSYLSTPWSYYAGNGTDEVPSWWYGAMSLFYCNTSANSQCNKPLRCYMVWSPQNQVDILSEYNGLITAGHKESADGHYAFGQVIRGYNALQNFSSMQTFLEGESDDRCRKLLIPMYLEQGEYGKMGEAINALTLTTRERTAYNNYYGLLESLKQDSRRIDSLTTTELALVHSLAADSLEVTPYAKGLLEWAYAEAWDHPIEPMPMDEMSYKIKVPETPGVAESRLMNAVPNPTSGITRITAFIGKREAMNNPILVIHDTKGKELFRQKLREGDNTVELNTTDWMPGIYLYSLNCNNRVMATKKLSVVK